MRFNFTFCFVLVLTSVGYAKNPKPYQTGKLLQMDSVECGTSEKGSLSVAGDVPATDAGKKTKELVCQEYTLQAQRVIYRIRPRNEKHPLLLPVGELAQFRLQHDKMLLKAEDFDGKEREYSVISMSPRTDSNTADATPLHLNHLQ